MLDHFNLPVSNLEKSTEFYQPILKTLGINILMQDQNAVGFGVDAWEFGIVLESGQIAKIHLAFQATCHEQVEKFYAAAISAGGLDNGAPGLRPEYSSAYYSAYVLDPDGHNLEAVFRG